MTESIFISDDISDSWDKLTDVQKAEMRVLFAKIRVKLVNEKISKFRIGYKISKESGK